MIVSTALTEPPASLADTVEDVGELTFVVFTANVIEVLPAGIVTVDETVAAGLVLESPMTSPPVGAGPLIVTVPVELFPPATDDGVNLREVRVGGLIVKFAVWVTPFDEAETAA